MQHPEVIFFVGIIGIVGTILLLIVALLFFSQKKKRLIKQLEAEYGSRETLAP